MIEVLGDITGEEAAETLTFGLDGVLYEIDLTVDNARDLTGYSFVASAIRLPSPGLEQPMRHPPGTP